MVRKPVTARVRGGLTPRLGMAVAAALTLAACSSGSAGTSAAPSGSASGSPSSSAGPSPSVSASASVPAGPLTLEVLPADSADQVRLDQPVSVAVSGGTLSGVTVKTSSGTVLAGQTAADGTRWTSSVALRSGSDYIVTAVAASADGSTKNVTSRFSTLRPARTFKVNILPQDGWDVGVGMPVIIYFSKSVKDKAAVERSLTVSSTPQVAGDWHWMSEKEIQWRPASFWPAGTKVSVKAAVSGVEAAKGLWGSRTVTSDFTIGSAMVSTVDVAKHTLTVTRDGKLVKTIPITTGKRGYETRAGTKVIISKETSRVMDAATTGVDSTDPNYYRINVRYAMRLTWSGEFLHAAPWSVGSQGRANVSHGCTGMSTSNARWLFNNSKVGDVVVYTHSKRSLEWGNGYTAWNMDFPSWSAA